MKIYSHAEDDLSSVKIRNLCANLSSGSPLAHCLIVHKNGIFAPLPFSRQWGLLKFTAGIHIPENVDSREWDNFSFEQGLFFCLGEIF